MTNQPRRTKRGGKLPSLLSKRPSQAAGTDELLTFLRRIVAWVFATGTEEDANLRLAALVEFLREEPEAARELGGALRRVVKDGQAARLFASTGLPTKTGLVAEFGKRLSHHFLPDPPLTGDLASVLYLLFPERETGRLVGGLEPERVRELFSLLEDPLESLREGIPAALILLAHRTAAQGLFDDFLERARAVEIGSSPFLSLPRVAEAFASAATEDRSSSGKKLHETIASCRRTAEEVHGHLEVTGVSLDLVFRLQVIDLGLARIQRLASLIEADWTQEGAPDIVSAGAKGMGEAIALTSSLVKGAWHERSLRSLARTNVQLLSRKIVEHTGETGDHYITSSRGEYFKMLASAGGGGVLTAGTTLAKFWIVAAKLPLLIEGFLAFLNYAGSFVAMQLAGFTLATKQPSATAATLAMALGKRKRKGYLDSWSEVVARITRSQLAAAVGNLGLVIPAVFLLEFFLRSRGNGPLLDVQTATKVVGSLHPFKSATLPLAALTGVLLWMSSMAAGAVQNWSAYRRLPESVASVRWVRRFLGERIARALEGFIGRNIAGLGGNVSLGFFLAMTPLLGTLLGLPLDVRHVTLSTGSLAFAVGSLGWGALASLDFFAAILGIGLIACLNFGVSFALALWVALRAEGFVREDRVGLLGALFKKLRKEPLDFVRPPPPKKEALVSTPEPGG